MARSNRTGQVVQCSRAIMAGVMPVVPSTLASHVDWIGYAAAVLTTTSFVPQVWLTWRTRDLSGISLGMYATFTIGIACWLAYGVVLGQWPVIIANSLTLVLAATILAMKLRETQQRKRGS
jgi:MtN3 and saliva related transmembrane protein